MKRELIEKKICLKCKRQTTVRWLCDECISKAVDNMTLEDKVKAAKVGMIALVDEATGFQDIRRDDELYNLYFKYLDNNPDI